MSSINSKNDLSTHPKKHFVLSEQHIIIRIYSSILSVPKCFTAIVMNYQSARFYAELGDLHVALLAVFLANGSELGMRTGGVLHGIAHVFEASH
jgi:hypothetical protein